MHSLPMQRFVTARTLVFIALFNLAIGVGLLAGWLFEGATSLLYDAPMRAKHGGCYLSIDNKGFDDEGNLVFIPWNYTESPQIPLLSLHREAVQGASLHAPLEPMDWAVLLYNLEKNHTSQLVICAPLAWDDKPNELITNALQTELKKFSHVTMGRAVTLSARGEAMPACWERLVLGEEQYSGDISKIPPANRLFGGDAMDLGMCTSAPSEIENDSLFHATRGDGRSAPLFIRWGERIMPTSTLMGALAAHGLSREDIQVHFGEKLWLGDHISIPIDDIGRVALRSDARALLLDPEEVIIPPDNVALIKKREDIGKILSNAPVTYIWEPYDDAASVSPSVLHDVKTVSSLLACVSPEKPLVLYKLPSVVMWVLLVDLVVIALWSLRFPTRLRRLILATCFALLAIAAVYFFIRDASWIPVVTLSASLLFVCLASFVIDPSQGSVNEQGLPERGDEAAALPETFEFHEPNEVPIPQKNTPHQSKTPKPKSKRMPASPHERSVLFVCTGNTCRSPLAEGLFRKAVSGVHPGWTVRSAGISAAEGAPASRETLIALKREGIDLSSHQSNQVDRELLEEATDVFVMTQGHMAVLLANFPEYADKVRLVTEYAGKKDIEDPFGCDQKEYDSVSRSLKLAIDAILKHWDALERGN